MYQFKKFDSKNFSTDAESQLLRLKIKRMDQEIRALGRKLTKLGSNFQDISEELNEIKEEDEDNENETDYTVQFDYKDLDNLSALNKSNEDIEAMKKEHEKQLELVNAKVFQLINITFLVRLLTWFNIESKICLKHTS